MLVVNRWEDGMAQAPWSIKVDQEARDRLAAAERERDEANARAGAVEELYGRFAGLIDRLDKAE